MRILHLFKWRIADILSHLPIIKKQGFDAIQISPLQPCKLSSLSDDWWKLYQPYGFSIGNTLGSENDLKTLCREASLYNIRVFADVVLNHVANDEYNHLSPHECVDEWLKSNDSFFKESKMVSDWGSRYEVTNYCIGVPSLDLAKYELQEKIVDFLNSYIDNGVSGFRIDAGKHIRLPKEGSDFFEKVFRRLNGKDLFNYAEVIYSDKDVIDEYCKYVYTLTDSQGSDKAKLVSYVDSHDLEKEFKSTKDMSSEDIARKYVDLCSEYEHTVFYAREFSDAWQDKLVLSAHK